LGGDTGEDRNYGLIVDRVERWGKWYFKTGVFRSEWVRREREVFQYLDAVTEAGDRHFGAILYPERDYGSWSGEVEGCARLRGCGRLASEPAAEVSADATFRVRTLPEADPRRSALPGRRPGATADGARARTTDRTIESRCAS
jgi:hypothetical protein